MVQAVAPPIATSTDQPAIKCRPPLRSVHTRASCISFATASGRDRGPLLSPRAKDQRPTTPRTRPMSSRAHSAHRRLTSDTTTNNWQFLTRPTSANPAPAGPQSSSSSSSRPRTRPATARDPPVPSPSPRLPRRPATSRPSSKPTAIDPRVLHEAVRRETHQTQYTGPLLGRSVDVQPPSSLLLPSGNQTHRDSRVVNAMSRAEFHRVRAFHARAKGEFSTAITHYEALLALRPTDTTALFQLAVAYDKTGRLQDALATYTRLLPLDGGNAFVHYNVGTLLLQLGKLPQAIDAFSAAIQRSIHDPQAAFFRQRGAAFRQNGEFEKAAQDYARVHAVHRRRASLAGGGGGASINIGSAPTVSASVDAEPRGTYSAEPIYSPGRFGVVDSAMEIIKFPTGGEALEVARKRPSQREDHELWTLSDALAAQFSLCGDLAPAAQRELSRRAIAATQLPGGTLLISEAALSQTGEPQEESREGKRDDGYVFFIARGRVDVYKAFRPHVASSANQKTEEEAASRNAPVSWEDLRLAVDEQDEGDQEWEASVQEATRPIDVPAWTSSDPALQQIVITQLGPGDVCGRQGRYLGLPRAYSVVVADGTCDVFALRWSDLREVERVHRLATTDQVTRFLGTLPLFHGIPGHELALLATHSAMPCRVTGSRVVCSPGQFVNGLLVVQHGAVCQLQPSTLDRPPTLAVSFSLSGTVGSESDDSRSGRQFFTQLEGVDDPLLFVDDSAATHGFLPLTFLATALNRATQATRLVRGGFFCAASSWIPPRASRVASANDESHGVACAKSALVSTESTTLLFFPSRELTQRLSLATRSLLHKNMQTLLARRATPSSQDTAKEEAEPAELIPTPLRRLQFLKPPEGDDLVQQAARDADWQQYKRELVDAIVAGRPRRPTTSR